MATNKIRSFLQKVHSVLQDNPFIVAVFFWLAVVVRFSFKFVTRAILTAGVLSFFLFMSITEGEVIDYETFASYRISVILIALTFALFFDLIKNILIKIDCYLYRVLKGSV